MHYFSFAKRFALGAHCRLVSVSLSKNDGTHPLLHFKSLHYAVQERVLLCQSQSDVNCSKCQIVLTRSTVTGFQQTRYHKKAAPLRGPSQCENCDVDAIASLTYIRSLLRREKEGKVAPRCQVKGFLNWQTSTISF